MCACVFMCVCLCFKYIKTYTSKSIVCIYAYLCIYVHILFMHRDTSILFSIHIVEKDKQSIIYLMHLYVTKLGMPMG